MNTSDNLKVADEVEGVEVAHEADLTELVVELFILFVLVIIVALFFHLLHGGCYSCLTTAANKNLNSYKISSLSKYVNALKMIIMTT
jgi:hypothetical protein